MSFLATISSLPYNSGQMFIPIGPLQLSFPDYFCVLATFCASERFKMLCLKLIQLQIQPSPSRYAKRAELIAQFRSIPHCTFRQCAQSNIHTCCHNSCPTLHKMKSHIHRDVGIVFGGVHDKIAMCCTAKARRRGIQLGLPSSLCHTLGSESQHCPLLILASRFPCFPP